MALSDDGFVAVTQLIGEDDDDSDQHTSVVVVEEGSGSVTVELPDGTHAIVHNALASDSQECLESVAIQLEDGNIRYLYGDTLLQAAVEHEIPDVQPQTVQQHQNRSANGASSQGKYICNYEGCAKSYTSANHLKTHQRIHTGDRPHECGICQKRFSTGYAVKAHLRTHTGEKPYQCPEELCGKCFKTSGDLQKHVRTHTGERPFKCDICFKSFTTSNIKKVHMRVHTGEKPYECNYDGCGRKFASATNYRNHCRIHTGEKPYVCSAKNCGKRFTEYSSLYKHHMVHNTQKRYYCSQCGRFYRQFSTLALHQRTVHGMVETVDDALLETVEISRERTLQINEMQVDQVMSSDDRYEESHHDQAAAAAQTISLLVKKEEEPQVLCSSLLSSDVGLEDNCIRNCIEVSSLIGGEHCEPMMQEDRGNHITNLELSNSGSGSILVLTDPSHLAALQQLAVGGSSTDGCRNISDSVEVIGLEDFVSVEDGSLMKAECCETFNDCDHSLTVHHVDEQLNDAEDRRKMAKLKTSLH